MKYILIVLFLLSSFMVSAAEFTIDAGDYFRFTNTTEENIPTTFFMFGLKSEEELILGFTPGAIIGIWNVSRHQSVVFGGFTLNNKTIFFENTIDRNSYFEFDIGVVVKNRKTSRLRDYGLLYAGFFLGHQINENHNFRFGLSHFSSGANFGQFIGKDNLGVGGKKPNRPAEFLTVGYVGTF